MSKKLRGNLLLMLTALIWGSSFVAQKEGMDLIGPFAFNGIRTVIGGLVLLPLIAVRGKGSKSSRSSRAEDLDSPGKGRQLIIGGLCCGLALFVASNLQQIGLAYTTVGHSGFITALYVVLVPLCGTFLHKRVRAMTWACVVASAFGLYLLCIPEGGFGSIKTGDLLTLACALCFTMHILIIDHFSPKVDGVKLSCIQFFVAGGLSVIAMFPLDPALGFDLPSMSGLVHSAAPLLYSGVLSCGMGYTLQIMAQRDTDPTIASMIMCLESVFALLAGMVILGEMLSIREAIGCAVMFAAIIVSQLPGRAEG